MMASHICHRSSRPQEDTRYKPVIIWDEVQDMFDDIVHQDITCAAQDHPDPSKNEEIPDSILFTFMKNMIANSDSQHMSQQEYITITQFP